MSLFAVIDTETNWGDQVMSIGTVLADDRTFQPVAYQYQVFPEACALGGMYLEAVFLDTPVPPSLCTREVGVDELRCWLIRNGVNSIFAYNACFDRNHLPELGNFNWYDIMRIAIYRQHNPKIPTCADCYSTGRMKRGYGVESMLRILSENCTYRETHNALFDALDELEIVRLLGHGIEEYNLL